MALHCLLSFGGRTAVGKGFGIPIVMRYVLEFATSVPEAVKIFERVPVHMSYTISRSTAQAGTRPSSSIRIVLPK